MPAPTNQHEAIAQLRALAAENETSLATKNDAEVAAQIEKAAVAE